MALSHNNLNSFESMLTKCESEGQFQILRNMIDRAEKEFKRSKLHSSKGPFVVYYQKNAAQYYRDGFPSIGTFDTLAEAKEAVENSRIRNVSKWTIRNEDHDVVSSKIKNWVDK